MNGFYNHGSVPAQASSGSSAAIRAEFDAITVGFGLLPTLGGNGSLLVRVNAGGTALEATAALPTLQGDLLFTDATYDIGKSGATRPRDGFFSRNVTIGGNVGVGTAPNTSQGILSSPSTLVGTSQDSFASVHTLSSAATGGGNGFVSSISTAAAAFTAANVYNFHVRNGSLGAASAITNYFGFQVDDITLGTNNYGFRGQVSSGSNKYNLYMDGTARNYLAGNFAVGVSAPSSATAILATHVSYSGGVENMFFTTPTWASASLTSYGALYGAGLTLTGNATVPTIYGFNLGVVDFGIATVTTFNGFLAPAFTGTATNAFAFRGSFATGANQYNLYMDGTAQNYLAGPLSVNSVSGADATIDIIQASNADWTLKNSATSGIFSISEKGVANWFIIAKTIGAVTLTGHVSGTPTFTAGDKYLVVDSSGHIHVSALGPVS